MSKKVPDHIAKEIKERVYQEADSVNYLARTRTDNSAFLTRLLVMPEVGLRLSQHMKKDEVRTYIKDAILNRYSKDKTQEERPVDIKHIIKKKIGIDAEFIECDNKNQTSLFKSTVENCFIVVSEGTVLKWETALRKALLYIASKPFSRETGAKVSIILTLFARHQKVSSSDIRQLGLALSLCKAVLYIYGDD